ncbi:MAG TPA: hypothetical protein VEZ49_03090 [Gemmatimonadales bacterium]|nr:hypothetical protein [Gemmatimonadales bacterium]
MTGIVRIFMLTSALLGLMLIGVAVAAWRQRRRLSSMVELLAAALCLSVGALCATIAVGIRGYNALTQEVVAATIVTEPLAPQRFRATVTLPDSSVRMFDLAGDAIYVDAHILKWRPLASLLGLHTAYELDRIAGRYARLADEQGRERTVYSLATNKPFNTFDLARRYWVLRPFVDAQYGSATFINATAAGGLRDARQVTYEIRVSTSGLLVRAARPR